MKLRLLPAVALVAAALPLLADIADSRRRSDELPRLVARYGANAEATFKVGLHRLAHLGCEFGVVAGCRRVASAVHSLVSKLV